MRKNICLNFMIEHLINGRPYGTLCLSDLLFYRMIVPMGLGRIALF